MQTEAECVTCCSGAAKCFVTSRLGERGKLLREEEPLERCEAPSATNKRVPIAVRLGFASVCVSVKGWSGALYQSREVLMLEKYI